MKAGELQSPAARISQSGAPGIHDHLCLRPCAARAEPNLRAVGQAHDLYADRASCRHLTPLCLRGHVVQVARIWRGRAGGRGHVVQDTQVAGTTQCQAFYPLFFHWRSDVYPSPWTLVKKRDMSGLCYRSSHASSMNCFVLLVPARGWFLFCFLFWGVVGGVPFSLRWQRGSVS